MHRIIMNTSNGYVANGSLPNLVMYERDRNRAMRFETKVDAMEMAMTLGIPTDSVSMETYAVA